MSIWLTEYAKIREKELDSDEGLKEMEIVTGRAIYLARQYNKKHLKMLIWRSSLLIEL